MRGKVTKINWQEDFDAYKKILLGKSKKVKEVFRFFNEIVFETATLATPVEDREDNLEELEDAIRAMNDDSSDSEATEDDRETLRTIQDITAATSALDIVNDKGNSNNEEPVVSATRVSSPTQISGNSSALSDSGPLEEDSANASLDNEIGVESEKTTAPKTKKPKAKTTRQKSTRGQKPKQADVLLDNVNDA